MSHWNDWTIASASWSAGRRVGGRRTGPERHWTLRATTVQWSFDLLSSPEPLVERSMLQV
ncbi:hypothetical protein ETD86_24255 [Nonomuraea turkmeniaca]|uniref:Uncharacterized protein n=1 Tax=Nonomuraea turkmeniaca TaxID=103838 RepID=A0A5S4FE28_9ACTN|nr:hypothetical protein [Nonomuraea turkmeniaca]TMR16765.1 hypothetical protein ETD86_24255 [Nonomuraea turkmeniaca]